MEEQRDFKGVWIPKAIYLDNRLTALEKIVLVEIDSLDSASGCFCSNEYLANFCQCSERKISDAIAKLLELGYITADSFDGRKRVLRSRVAKTARQGSKNCEADGDIHYISNNKDNNNISPASKSGQRRKAAVNEDVEELFESLWRLYPRKEGKRKVTNDAKNALAKAGFDKVAAAIAAYKEQIERNKTEDRYVKHGSTFFNGDWQDYVADNDAYIKSAQDYVNGGFESY